jgi:hypothetical protein
MKNILSSKMLSLTSVSHWCRLPACRMKPVAVLPLCQQKSGMFCNKNVANIFLIRIFNLSLKALWILDRAKAGNPGGCAG